MQNECNEVKVTRESLLQDLSHSLHQLIIDFENKYNCGVMVKLPTEPNTRFKLMSNLKNRQD